MRPSDRVIEIFEAARPTFGHDVRPESTAVVTVDMQNGFCHPDGSLYAPGSEEAIGGCVELIVVKHTYDTFYKESRQSASGSFGNRRFP
jgi:hypothetical protein